MRDILKIFVICTIILIGIDPRTRAIDISVTGDWYLIIDSSDLSGGPGSDLNANYRSARDEIVVDITNTNSRWRVDIEGTVVTKWHSDMILQVRRTSDGSGSGNIRGGTNWKEVRQTSRSFFRGRRARTGIEVQYRLRGVSVNIPPDTYEKRITYTVTEL